ncbi:hypothetical protein KP509_1Z087900 [Ceratopteris richardii]|nr:hypothetical protein KP509_1Z087900 [Ceratopteris richardii]
MAKLQHSAAEKITQRLSALPDIHLPFSLVKQGESLSQADKKAHLFDLINRDAAIFLERHGSKLSVAELKEFDVFSGDYEVDWHLRRLRRSLYPATAKEQKAQANLVKNRRLAFMSRLIDDGDFFSENAMRLRAPLLYHEYLGQFQDPSERSFARPGERWSDMLIRQGEEAEYQARLRTEREKAGIPTEDGGSLHTSLEEDEEEEDEEKEEEEVETEEKNVKEGAKEGEKEEDHKEQSSVEQHVSRTGAHRIPAGMSGFHTNTEPWSSEVENRTLSFEERQCLKLQRFSQYMHDKFIGGENVKQPTISKEELQSNMEDFTRIMQEKFLSGEDFDHFDYVHIDNDMALDDYWLDEISQDAEDRYFEED